MKKNLFLLFSFYFFVGQAVIVGILWKMSNMFWLAGINLVAILLITLLFGLFGGEEKEEGKEKAKKPVHEAKPEEKEVVTHVPPHAKKASKSGGSSTIPFIVSIIVGIVSFKFTAGADLGMRMIMTTTDASIIFIILCLLWKVQWKWFNRLLGTWFYRILLFVSILFTGYQFMTQASATKVAFLPYVANNIMATEIINPSAELNLDDDAYLLTGEGMVLETGVDTGEMISGDLVSLFSGVQSDVVSGNSEAAPVVVPPTPSTPVVAEGKSLHMIDMIKYLIKTYNVPLVSKKDVKFKYVSTTSPDYVYMRTAYANKLIGAGTSTDKLALCDTYIVMKGILEGRILPASKASIMSKYRSYAETNNKLNGCVKWAVIKDSNL